MVFNRKVCSLPPLAELFYRRMVEMVDSEGRCLGGPDQLFALCYPLDSGTPEEDRIPIITNIKMWREAIVDAGLAVAYEVDGVQYLRLKALRFTNPRTKSKLPAEPAPVQLDLETSVAFQNDEKSANLLMVPLTIPSLTQLTPSLPSELYTTNTYIARGSQGVNHLTGNDIPDWSTETINVSKSEHENFVALINRKNIVESYHAMAAWWNRYHALHTNDGTKVTRSGTSIGAQPLQSWRNRIEEPIFVENAPLLVHLAFKSDSLTGRKRDRSKYPNWRMRFPWLIRRQTTYMGLLEGVYQFLNDQEMATPQLDPDIVLEYLMTQSPRKMFRAMLYDEAMRVVVAFIDYWERFKGKDRHKDWKTTLDSLTDPRIVGVRQ
jgi:hypothetical protein